MKTIWQLILVVLFLYVFNSCNTTEPPVLPPKPPPEQQKAIKLKLLDVSCTEAFINVTASDTVLPVNISLTRDDSALFNFTLGQTDTVVIDTTLQPNKTYIYQTTAEINGKEEKSDTLQVKSLNITSDNFTWQTFTFGIPEGGSSALYDAAIINSSNMWAVGEIYNDTTGQAFNAVHWDGSQWELKRINMLSSCNPVTYPPLRAIWAFSDSNIIVTSGGSIGWFDGTINTPDCNIRPLLTGSINKIFGKSSTDFYVVGNGGNIAHYQNGTWIKIESGTTTNINDIWGYYNSSSKEESVLCVASNILHQGEYRLLSISGNTAHDTLNWAYNDYWLKTVWLNNKYSPVYIGGGGIKVYKRDHWEEQHITNEFIECIRGSEVNDILASGDNGFLGHFNGMHWHVYSNLYNDAAFLSAAVNNNTAVIVGYTFSGLLVGQAIIIIGTRTK